MAKLATYFHEAISHQLHLLYDGIIAEGVPDRLIAILATADGDPARDDIRPGHVNAVRVCLFDGPDGDVEVVAEIKR
jgi:hypothetical protein